MPGRRGLPSDGAYRYGFNGKELDTDGEWGGNMYDYGFRIYNPRLGKFLSLDPLFQSYPWYTPYQFAGNKPIWAIDLDGLEESIATLQMDMDNRALLGDKSVGYSLTQDQWRERGEARAMGAILGITAIVDVYVTKGWLSRTLLFYNLGESINHTERAYEAKDAGNEELAQYHLKKSGEHNVEIAIDLVIPAGLKALRAARLRLARGWGLDLKYVNLGKPVYTRTLEEGTELIQYRVRGTEGTYGNYYAKPGTRPEQIGLDPGDVIETYKVKVTKETKVVVSTHAEDATYYRNPEVKVEGGGTQIKSNELKNNATFEKVETVNTDG